MAGEQFHIFIYGGSETAARGRDFLRGQDAELERSANGFLQCCRNEQEAFECTIKSMDAQYSNSWNLANEAKPPVDKARNLICKADGIVSMFSNYASVAEQMVVEAESLLSRANHALECCRMELYRTNDELKSVQDSIKDKQSRIKGFQNEIKMYREKYKDAVKSGSQGAASEARGNIERCQSCIKSIEEPFLHWDQERCEKLSEKKDLYDRKFKFYTQMRTDAEAARGAAQAHLQICRQKVVEAEALKRRTEALAQRANANLENAEKSHRDDCEKSRLLKKNAKESKRQLSDLSDGSSRIQRDASENLRDNAAIMDKLVRLMYDYENFSISGGR